MPVEAARQDNKEETERDKYYELWREERNEVKSALKWGKREGRKESKGSKIESLCDLVIY